MDDGVSDCEVVPVCAAAGCDSLYHEEVPEEGADVDASSRAEDGEAKGSGCGLGAGLFYFILPPFHLIYVVNAKTALFRANLM